MANQSCRTYHFPSKVLTESTTPLYENRIEVGPTTTTVLAQKGPTHLDKDTPIVHRERSSNKQHNLHDSNSDTMV